LWRCISTISSPVDVLIRIEKEQAKEEGKGGKNGRQERRNKQRITCTDGWRNGWLD
jgi:hypothetical protein